MTWGIRHEPVVWGVNLRHEVLGMRNNRMRNEAMRRRRWREWVSPRPRDEGEKVKYPSDDWRLTICGSLRRENFRWLLISSIFILSRRILFYHHPFVSFCEGESNTHERSWMDKNDKSARLFFALRLNNATKTCAVWTCWTCGAAVQNEWTRLASYHRIEH